MLIGDIYNKSAWSNLADFLSSGSGFSVVSGKIQSAVNSGETNFLRFAPTALDEMAFQVSFKWLADAASGNICKIGMKSVNAASEETVLISIVGTGANKGKIKIDYTYPTPTTVFSSTALSPVVNDIITIGVAKTSQTWPAHIFTVFASIGATVINMDIPGPWNGAYPSIYGTANTYEIQNVRFSSDMQKYPDYAAMGDSITYGSGADTHAERWIEIINAKSASAGPGDATADYIARVNDITNIIQPRKLFILGGTNDRAESVSDSVIVANLLSLITTIEFKGVCKCVVLTPPPNSSRDMTPTRNAIVAAFPSKSIDIFTPLKATSGTGYNPAYDADGTHPNPAGHALIGSAVSGHSLYVIHPTVKANQPNVVVSKRDCTFQDAGIIDDNTLVIYKIDSALLSYVPGRDINGFTGFVTDGGYYWVAKQTIDLSGVLMPPSGG